MNLLVKAMLSGDKPKVEFAEMRLFFPLLLTLFLARTSSTREIHQEIDQLKQPNLHLPLYHVRGKSTNSLEKQETDFSFSEALALDEARVEFLNSRLTKKNSTTFHSIPTSTITRSGSFLDQKSVNIPLNPGVPLGVANYYTRIGLGTPPTYHLVVVDTGSSFSWIQCQPCLVYCHSQSGSPFNPSVSGTYQRLPCNTRQCSSLKTATLNTPMCTTSNVCIYTATYGDQSFSLGYLSKDSLTLGSSSLPGFIFGCGQDNEGLFGKSAGLVGLAKNELSLLSQLSTKYGKAFSYCLPSATPLGQTGSGGFLSIGSSLHSAYKFTPMITDSRDPTLYFLKLVAISVSGKPLGLAASSYSVPTIIDSGTTISRLAPTVYTALRDNLVKIISSKYRKAGAFSILDSCFMGSANEISTAVPPVKMIFQGGAELSLNPHNVIIEVEKGTTCLAFAGSNRDVAIIGNQQQQTFDVVYDLASSKIGFAAGGCR